MIAIVDYGAGNVRSVEQALRAVGAECKLTTDHHEILQADGVVLPGVGAARDTMDNLAARDLIDPVVEVVNAGRPFLGICMGMQALMTMSEEDGGQPCLDLVAGRVKLFGGDLPVPHMGWNEVQQTSADHPLYDGIPDGAAFYFAHSYYCVPEHEDAALATTDYGLNFASSLGAGNVMGVQFHPEKSGRWGLRLLQNFVAITAAGGVEQKRTALVEAGK